MDEDDYVYEDDWEEEPEKKDSEEERRSTDDESQPAKETPHLSGTPFPLPNEQTINKMDGDFVSNVILEQNLCYFHALLQVNSLKMYLISSP